MAVIHDIGNAGNIHPRNKQDVGDRLAQWALHQTYEQDVVPCGPLFKKIEVDGNKIRIHFDHVGDGLMVGSKEGLAPTKEVRTASSNVLPSPVRIKHGSGLKPSSTEIRSSSPATPWPSLSPSAAVTP
jgi:hypothetical protein